MGSISEYDLWAGIEFIGSVVLVIGLFLLSFLSVQLYRCLQAQDDALSSGAVLDLRSQVLDIVKRTILWVVGYKGEAREKTPISEIDVHWISRYRGTIILRFFPIYALYIYSLVFLTRPVFFDGENYLIFEYTKNIFELYAMLIIYIISNVLFDYFSIRFSLSHIISAQHSGRYYFYFLKDAVFAFALFLPSQIVSCFLWIYKRQNPLFPEFENGILRSFIEITFWPYAFVDDAGTGQIVSELFPGQLLITGTVFFPTVVLVALFVVYSLFLNGAFLVKKAFVSRKLDRLCRAFLKANLIGIFEAESKLVKFGYCNLALLVLLNLCFVTAVSLIAGLVV